MSVSEQDKLTLATMLEDFALVYGRSSAGKSTWVAQLAEFIFATTGKKTRIYIGDGGAATYVNMGLVEDGIVDLWDFAQWSEPLYTIQKAVEGYWPVDVDTPDAPLALAPDLDATIGLHVFEGLTVVAEYIMGSTPGGLADRAAKGEKIGQDSPFVVRSKDVQLGGNSMAHFAFAQRRMTDYILKSKRLPGMKVWTAHERQVEDKEENETIIGPDCAGKALTPKIPMWFGNTIHMTTATKKEKRKDPLTQKDVDIYNVERRAYTREHGDPDGVVFRRYVASSRVSLLKDAKTGALMNPLPEFLAPPDPVRYYQLLAEAKAKRQAARGLAVAA